jgi:glycosyltransferase involved in cell wall biosynthesis
LIDEVIVVDNNSTDKSKDVALVYNACVIEEQKKGYGAAILRGLESASGDIVVVMDADNSYPLFFSEQLCAELIEGDYDVITGCRFPLSESKAMPCMNLLANYLISFLIRVLFNVDIIDSQSGMFILRKGITQRLGVVERGMAFSQEIKIRAWIDHCVKKKETWIPYSRREGKVKFRNIIDSFKNLSFVVRFYSKGRRKIVQY